MAEITPHLDNFRRQLLIASTSFATGVTFPSTGYSQVNSSIKPSIVFCHGIWADGSCFHKLIPTLQAEGHEVVAAQYGLDTLKGDVAAAVRTFGRVKGPIVLVGHSYGGSVITYAGTDPRVSALVYIAALAPDEIETSQAQQDKFPVTDIFQYVEVQDGRVWVKPDGVKAFAGDLSAEEQGLTYATLYPCAADLFQNKPVGAAAWKTKPSTYIVTTDDRTVHPELQRAAAKRMGATVVEVKSSHVAMLSHPDVVLDAIRKAAAVVSARRT
jgi:pimeloyl-ACP methyl ester carboxylesterase